MTADMEKYRCTVCGGFDFDDEGNSEACPGPPREEPDYDESDGWDNFEISWVIDTDDSGEAY